MFTCLATLTRTTEPPDTQQHSQAREETTYVYPIFKTFIYPKVASSRLSRLVAHSMIFRRLMKEKFEPYVL